MSGPFACAIIPPMPASPEIRVRVLLLARYAELLGGGEVEVAVPAGGTVADAIVAVRALPGGQRLPRTLLVARNLEQAGPGDPVHAGDELALLPPMSGG
jgi:molybdopterin converting factor small subunit